MIKHISPLGLVTRCHLGMSESPHPPFWTCSQIWHIFFYIIPNVSSQWYRGWPSYFGKPHRLRWRIARLTGHPWDLFHTLWNPDDKSFPKSSEPFLWVVYEPRNSQSKLVRFSKIWWTSSVISTSSVSADISTSSSDLNCSAILNILFTFTFISYNTQQSFMIFKEWGLLYQLARRGLQKPVQA